MKKYINISDVLWFQEGPGVRNTQYTTDGVKLLNVTNLINGNVDTTNTNRYISKEEAYGKYKHFLADEGDLVIASSGIKVEYFDKKMGFIRKEQLPLCMNTSTIRFKVTDEKRLSIRYFMYYLKSNHFKEQLGQQITGSAQLNFGPSHLKKMVFPLIEMEEQAKIIDKLDTIYDIEYKMRTELKLYDQLASSLFIEMFGDPVENPKKWDIIQLHDRCDIVTGNTPAREKSEYYGNYIEWIKSDNINTDDMYLTVAEEYLSKKGLLVGRCVEAGSILMTCIAGSIGCIGNVGVANRKVAFNQQINAIVPNKDSNIFIYWLMVLSKKYIQGTVNMSLKGILSKGKLSELYFPFPPIELQHKFEKSAIVIDKSKLAVKKSLEELEILKKSLMQKYFA